MKSFLSVSLIWQVHELTTPHSNCIYTRVVKLSDIRLNRSSRRCRPPGAVFIIQRIIVAFSFKNMTPLCYMTDCVSIFHHTAHQWGSMQGVTVFLEGFGVMWCESQWKELKTNRELTERSASFIKMVLMSLLDSLSLSTLTWQLTSWQRTTISPTSSSLR